MLPLERHRLIVELLGQHGVMRVNEIAQATRVSRSCWKSMAPVTATPTARCWAPAHRY